MGFFGKVCEEAAGTSFSRWKKFDTNYWVSMEKIEGKFSKFQENH